MRLLLQGEGGGEDLASKGGDRDQEVGSSIRKIPKVFQTPF